MLSAPLWNGRNNSTAAEVETYSSRLIRESNLSKEIDRRKESNWHGHGEVGLASYQFLLNGP